MLSIYDMGWTNLQSNTTPRKYVRKHEMFKVDKQCGCMCLRTAAVDDVIHMDRGDFDFDVRWDPVL